MKTVKMRHPKRDRKAAVPVDRVDLYRSQGWVEAQSEKPPKPAADAPAPEPSDG